MSAELAQKIAQMEQQIKGMTSQIEVLNAEVQEKVAQGVAYRTNLHITQKAFQELNTKFQTSEVKVKELEEKLKPHLVEKTA